MYTILVVFLFVFSSQADDVIVAVASNFNKPIERISALFKERHGHSIIISSGASGKFYTQIVNGAPYDVFLSADQVHPKKLIAAKLADKETLITYAIGQLVLWGPDLKLVDYKGHFLQKKSFKHLSIANPKLAPYGKASKEVLESLGLWDVLQRKFVFGENITQAYQFVASGNAELGFVALSQLKGEGPYWLVPQNLYSPIKQDAILLAHGKNNFAAKIFLNFLKSSDVKKIITEYGYKHD